MLYFNRRLVENVTITVNRLHPGKSKGKQKQKAKSELDSVDGGRWRRHHCQADRACRDMGACSED